MNPIKSGRQYEKNHPWVSHCWHARDRCVNKNNPSYPWYGGKGIRFLMTPKDFEFLWNRDKAGKMKIPSIDRYNPNEDYILENCRFVEFSVNVKRAHLSREVKVKQSTLNGVFIRMFDCIADTYRFLGKTNDSNITQCIKGRRKTAYGYKWERA